MHSCYVTSVSVLPEWSGRGIAAALLAELMECAAETKVESVTLEVSKQSSAALALYRRFGFEQIDERDDVAVMELGLPMAVTNVLGRLR